MQAAFGRQIRIGDARHVDGVAGDLLGVALSELGSISLRGNPLAPVLDRPAVLGQERGVAVSAAEGAADVGIAGPVEAAAADEAGGRGEDRTRFDELHG